MWKLFGPCNIKMLTGNLYCDILFTLPVCKCVCLRLNIEEFFTDSKLHLTACSLSAVTFISLCHKQLTHQLLNATIFQDQIRNEANFSHVSMKCFRQKQTAHFNIVAQ